ncbi:phospholipid scramblase 2-like [Topomyia yanbarensis]|uniref:phospholipid scramblase 2-like n=1 Tax=Topomyia yanbarensis TaxID=2498891 RepID=UPI00273AE987|nr:phospholipid scramblase 2-like [Topomyia yanbarensis]
MNMEKAEYQNDVVKQPPPLYLPPTGPPISKQPFPCETVPPLEFTNCPGGLESLLDTEVMKFKQEINWLQIFCGVDMRINFDLSNQHDTMIFRMEETEDCCMRNCVPHGFRTGSKMIKPDGWLALQFNREGRCVFNCCTPCCCYPLPFSSERLSVRAANGVLLGVVQQDWSIWTSRFSVLDAEGKTVLKIEGPKLNFACFGDIQYRIVALNGSEVGSITKHYAGFVCDACADFDDFTINFPRDLDVTVKATLLGAVNLINFLFFQGSLRRLAIGVCFGSLRVAVNPR